MDHLIVRTKLQAVIAKQLLDDNVIKPPFHLIQLLRDGEPGIDIYCERLAPFAGKITKLARPKLGFTRLFTYFLYLLAKCRIRNEQLFLASLNWYPFALALKLVPGLMICTFDDGAANIQENSIYFSEASSDEIGFRGWLARLIFRKSPSFFVRSRVHRHYTIYPGLKNIVDESNLLVVKIEWDKLLEKIDIELLPKDVTKILLGTVYKEAAQVWNLSITENDVRKAIEWADLYVPHPRQSGNVPPPEVVKRYPAETIISHYSKIQRITVAHFNSSAAIPFWNNPRVQLIDLTRESVQSLTNESGRFSS